MSDDLIKRLRFDANDVRNHHSSTIANRMTEAADLIEQQAARIASLEAQLAAAEKQEPVAWQVHPFDYGIGSEGVYARTDRPDQVEAWKQKGWHVTSLYAAPLQSEGRRKDAERYRWLRARCRLLAAEDRDFVIKCANVKKMGSMDAVIDAALAKQDTHSNG